MFLLYFLLYFFLRLAPLYYSVKILKLEWFNPVTIIIFVNLPIDIFKIIIGPYFLLEGEPSNGLFFAYNMTLIRLFFEFTVVMFFLKTKQFRQLANYFVTNTKKNFNNSSYSKLQNIFLFLSFIFFVFLMIGSGVYLEWFINPRDSYVNNRVGNGLFYALSLNFLSISIFFSFLKSINIKQLIISFLFFMILLYPYGSKGLYLNLFIFFLIMVYRIKRKETIKYSIPAGIIVVFAILYNFSTDILSISFDQISAYFDYYFNAANYYDDYFAGLHELQEGKIFLSSLWEYVPRALYDDKPFVYGILNIVEYYYPGGPASGNTPAFGGEVVKFADFGVFGVIFFSVLNITLIIKALFYIILFRNNIFFKNEFSLLEILIMLYLFAPSFGIYAPSILYLILIIIVSIIMVIFRRLKFRFI